MRVDLHHLIPRVFSFIQAGLCGPFTFILILSVVVFTVGITVGFGVPKVPDDGPTMTVVSPATLEGRTISLEAEVRRVNRRLEVVEGMVGDGRPGERKGVGR